MNRISALAIYFSLLFATPVLRGQCSGPSTCAQGNHDPRYEQVDIGNLSDAVFESGETRVVEVGVVKGTLFEAANNDREYVHVFLDLDCDGVFEYEVEDDCRYKPNKGGCTVDLEISVPIVTAASTFRGRAVVSYNRPANNACSGVAQGWGDIKDFTITVNPSCTVTAALSSSDGDNMLCAGESVTFTGSGGDDYEFYVNGNVVQSRSGSAQYTSSTLEDGDRVSVRVYSNTGGGCDDLSGELTHTVLNPAISSQPVNQVVVEGSDAIFSASASDANSYQWQVSTDNGINFSDVSDGGLYSGSTTSSLTVNQPGIHLDGAQFRVLVNYTAVNCSGAIASNAVLLQVRVGTVVTNRRLTYRVSPEN